MRTFEILVALTFLVYGVWLLVRPVQVMAHFVGKRNPHAQEMLKSPQLPWVARTIGVAFIILALSLIFPSY
jgi:threonine/homoserine/homoserine lactone efflux protein